MEGLAFASFHDVEEPDPDELLRTTLAVCRSHGLAESGADDPVDPDALGLDDGNRLQLFWGNRKVRLTFNVGDDWLGPPRPVLDVKTDTNVFERDAERSGEEYVGILGDYVHLLRDLAIAIDPVYVSTFNTTHGDGTPSPDAVLAFEEPIDLDRIPWLGIYSERLVEQFGGREHVLATPAWCVEELENGSVLIVTTKVPWDGYREELPADQHLLGDGASSSATEQSTRRDDSEPEFSDPFAALEPGEYGTAVGVPPGDVADEFRNEDLQLVRVYVGEDGTLRRVDDDSFVRHVVEQGDSDAEMIRAQLADLPPTASDDGLLASALFHPAIPPTFVRLDGPGGENVATKVLDLDADVSKYDLLVKLGDATRAEGFDEADLETMEEAMDTLSDLEDVEGIDEWIEEYFFG